MLFSLDTGAYYVIHNLHSEIYAPYFYKLLTFNVKVDMSKGKSPLIGFSPINKI